MLMPIHQVTSLHQLVFLLITNILNGMKPDMKLNRSLVLPVFKAIQGGPESGRIWEKHFNSIIVSQDLGFHTTNHSRCIYCLVFDGQIIFLLRSVESFAISCKCPHIADKIFDIISRKLQLPNKKEPPFEKFIDFNGKDINQTKQ